MTWSRHLHRLGGAASTRQLLDAGATEHELTAAVARGALLRPRKGRYVSAGAPEPVRSAFRVGGRLSCVSAAQSCGLWAGTDRRLHVVVPPHSGRSAGDETDVVRHWRPCESHPEIWRVSLADCLRTVARCADPETAVAVLDTAISSGQASLPRLRQFFTGEPQRSRALAARAHPGSDSGVESILRQRLAARGHVIEQQVHVHGVGLVDLRVDGVLFVEVDGFAFHSDRESFERDRARDTALTLRGARSLRLTARQVLDGPADAVAMVEAALAMLDREERHVALAV
ncbi:hypothetical protein [Leifsonia xyli]|uniref:hypothetical protein n=1 Tax=Leifsonia xyli TaxID=1575 RepID=UPI003D671912